MKAYLILLLLVQTVNISCSKKSSSGEAETPLEVCSNKSFPSTPVTISYLHENEDEFLEKTEWFDLEGFAGVQTLTPECEVCLPIRYLTISHYDYKSKIGVDPTYLVNEFGNDGMFHLITCDDQSIETCNGIFLRFGQGFRARLIRRDVEKNLLDDANLVLAFPNPNPNPLGCDAGPCCY